MAMSPRLLRPRATGFNPKSISGLAAWWDFSDATTVTVATGISSVTDKSGNGRRLIQNTANNQPAYTASSINGKYAAVFDGSNDALNSAFTLVQPVIVFIVGKWNTSASGTQTMFDGNSGNTMRLFRNASNQVALYAGAQLTSSTTTPELFHAYQLTFSGVNSAISADGQTLVSGNAGTSAANGVWLGVFGNGFSNPCSCTIAEVLIYSVAIASSSASNIRKYLGSKYGITVT